jgi:outer membrane protein insertion porin family
MFTNVTAGVTSFFTIDEDYLGRRSVLRVSSDIGYIFGGDAPVYERYYLGGRSFRGFEFRTISPKASGSIGAPDTPINEPVGGDFLFFLGLQYEVPLYDQFLAGVVFIDSGTVDDTVSLDEYRVSVGFGFRLFLDALGPAPLAFDLGFPILKEDEDLTQLISFSAELPF